MKDVKKLRLSAMVQEYRRLYGSPQPNLFGEKEWTPRKTGIATGTIHYDRLDPLSWMSTGSTIPYYDYEGMPPNLDLVSELSFGGEGEVTFQSLKSRQT